MPTHVFKTTLYTSTANAASVNSAAVDVSMFTSVSVEAVSGALIVGTIKLQVSDSVSETAPSDSDTSWCDVTGTSTALSSATTPITWNWDGIATRWLRAAYTRTSGTDSLVITCAGKGF